MVTIVEYEQQGGRKPFSKWFASLNTQATLKIRTAIARMEDGNFSNVKSVGQGVNEYRLAYGPGYRIYFGRDGETLVILLGGGTKKRQNNDIEAAKEHWNNYKMRKR
jgi:putative addiction module killer protein